ncbi:hypothetical protein K461DRAFT_148027 [Myriangium duriaei CBS 260.36]|uniref:RING-type domain-containing protein n=1 Tax=Myriangium duriaei CBS 260.36 TaxID=1168546 RepID=A0A9P4J1R4_9PEZI|nr:hypothetical protein K461DRAFT_148027 [Myriangium duriaei CBS 260.36]
MDFQLRCNSLSCRTSLSERAVVTTCSHIFCEPCSNTLVLPDARHASRTCPACGTPLNNPDDAVLTSLNPSEDYKTSVLSGLSPATILECANRGVLFFQYQATQELTYQGHMSRNLTEKYHVLGAQMDSVISEANSEIVSLRDRLEASHAERKDLEKKNSELIDAFKAKSTALQKLQKLYQDSRKRADAAAVQDAAAVNVEDVLQSATSQGFYSHAPQRPAQAHMTGNRSPSILLNRRQAGTSSAGNVARPSAWDNQNTSHRQRLGLPPYGNTVASVPSIHSNNILHPTPVRQPLRSMDQDSAPFGNQSKHGLGGGARIGRNVGVSTNRGSGAAGRNLGHSILGMR